MSAHADKKRSRSDWEKEKMLDFFEGVDAEAQLKEYEEMMSKYKAEGDETKYEDYREKASMLNSQIESYRMVLETRAEEEEDSDEEYAKQRAKDDAEYRQTKTTDLFERIDKIERWLDDREAKRLPATRDSRELSED